MIVPKPNVKVGAWKTIMVVDPDPDNRKRVVGLLREAALRASDSETATPPPANSRTLAVHEADNGSAAWALIEVVKPDLVVAEILLEGISGMQLLRRLRDRYGGDAPAMIFVTSMSNEVDRYWALRNGATAYVIKPFDDDFLRTRATKFFEDRVESGLDLDSNWVADP
ncbi:Transcriptional regulatory protein YycF [Enhygromyxa salina]|uniref:Transcriptional regulatory protein YycF n=1 Tax=Enhygromyxa salina TaxID=215803 RepID=A0A2S9YNV9_9BACT|nr:Transcriptional regulatory protein YycF [Enhygromyxa salina]